MDPLAPVRAALLADARARRRGGRWPPPTPRSDALRRRTAAECERVRSEARERGERDAADLVAAERARVRRQARALVLEARGRAYAELRRRVHEAAVAVRDAADYPALRDRLVTRARAPGRATGRRSPTARTAGSWRRTATAAPCCP